MTGLMSHPKPLPRNIMPGGEEFSGNQGWGLGLEALTLVTLKAHI